VLRMELAKRLKSGGVCEKPKDGGHSSLDSGELRWCCLLFVGSVVIVVDWCRVGWLCDGCDGRCCLTKRE